VGEGRRIDDDVGWRGQAVEEAAQRPRIGDVDLVDVDGGHHLAARRAPEALDQRSTELPVASSDDPA
jgi:hypothetical protein